MAARNEGEFFESGETDDFGDFFGRSRLGDGGRKDLVNGVLDADCGIGTDTKGADGGFEASSEIGGSSHLREADCRE